MSKQSILIRVCFEGEPTFSGIRPHNSGEPFEWPPSPTRLLSALLAGASAVAGTNKEIFEETSGALQILESLPAPSIIAAPYVDNARDPLHYAPKLADYPTSSWTLDKQNELVPPARAKRAAYVNALRKTVWPGFKGMSEVASVGKRVNGARTLAHPELVYVVRGLKGLNIQDLVKKLDLAAQGVPYFGASRDTASLIVEAGAFDQSALENRVIYRPLGIRGNTRGWGPGLVDHLIRRHRSLTTKGEDIGHPDHLIKKISYQPFISLDEVPTLTVAVAKTPHITETARCIEEINQAIDEHQLPVKVIPMVNHLHEYSDGRLKGILIIPDPLDVEDGFTKIAEAAPVLINSEKFPWLDELAISTGQDNKLKSLELKTVLTSTHKWRSATPVRSYPETNYAKARLMLDLGKQFGLNPEDIELVLSPATAATRSYGCGHTLGATPRLDRGMVPWHVQVNFPHDVPGPIQIGADTKLGYGLLIPDPLSDSNGE